MFLSSSPPALSILASLSASPSPLPSPLRDGECVVSVKCEWWSSLVVLVCTTQRTLSLPSKLVPAPLCIPHPPPPPVRRDSDGDNARRVLHPAVLPTILQASACLVPSPSPPSPSPSPSGPVVACVSASSHHATLQVFDVHSQSVVATKSLSPPFLPLALTSSSSLLFLSSPSCISVFDPLTLAPLPSPSVLPSPSSCRPPALRSSPPSSSSLASSPSPSPSVSPVPSPCLYASPAERAREGAGLPEAMSLGQGVPSSLPIAVCAHYRWVAMACTHTEVAAIHHAHASQQQSRNQGERDGEGEDEDVEWKEEAETPYVRIAKNVAKGVMAYGDRVFNEARNMGKHRQGHEEGDHGGDFDQEPAALGGVKIVDVVSREVLCAFSAHESTITHLSFDPSGMLLATCSSSGKAIHVYNVSTRAPSTHKHKPLIPPCSRAHPNKEGGEQARQGSGQGGARAEGRGGNGEARARCRKVCTLARGVTRAEWAHVVWSWDARWLAATTKRGTTHVFEVHNCKQAACGFAPHPVVGSCPAASPRCSALPVRQAACRLREDSAWGVSRSLPGAAAFFQSQPVSLPLSASSRPPACVVCVVGVDGRVSRYGVVPISPRPANGPTHQAALEHTGSVIAVQQGAKEGAEAHSASHSAPPSPSQPAEQWKSSVETHTLPGPAVPLWASPQFLFNGKTCSAMGDVKGGNAVHQSDVEVVLRHDEGSFASMSRVIADALASPLEFDHPSAPQQAQQEEDGAVCMGKLEIRDDFL